MRACVCVSLVTDFVDVCINTSINYACFYLHFRVPCVCLRVQIPDVI